MNAKIDWETFYASFRRPGFIPGYEIQNHLGGGAFGEVYKARKSSIGKSYAIKFLRLDEESQREVVERELEQVRLFASIDHPNLVTIEDMGVVLGVPFLIMGYAGEDTLARRLKREELDGESAMRYFVQAARGVLALHDRRLAHFDLKPSNVFLRGDVARVGDYGLAKLLVEGRQTLSFGRGTPHYMAPEMLKSRADHRADVYSLGVILFESLTFRLPFGADGSPVLRESDEAPNFPAEFPGELRPVVERCLRIDPAERFASVQELLAAMGQTPRLGDSIVLPAASPARTRAELAPAGGVADLPRSDGDLRQAASELARGAAGVARGVWGGVFSRGGPARDGADGRLERGSGIPADRSPDVVSVQTLEDSEELPASAPDAVGSARPDSAWRRELAWGEGAAGGSERAAQRQGRAVAATVPVPPSAEGGWMGSLVQSLVVGAEVMGALVTGPLLAGLRAVAAWFDRLVRGVPGVLGAVIRFVMLLVLMALLGGLVSFLLLAAVAWGT